MTKLKFALFGAGFWPQFQLPGWLETGEVECVAICDTEKIKAQTLARRFKLNVNIYDIAEELFENETLDFVDICTSVETHAPLTLMAAARGIPIICQKPMATTLAEAEMMVKACADAGVLFMVNENWRWQEPIRRFKRQLDTGNIGQPFRARIDYRNSYPVFENQPFLKELDQFILTDMGSHILDVARFLFGDAMTMYCHTNRVHPDINGEDVATCMMKTESGTTVICEMSYATKCEHDRFPETYIQVEGNAGFLELAPDFWLRETTETDTLATRRPPYHYEWALATHDVIHSSIVPTHTNFIQALRGETSAETSGADNLKTMQLIFAAYQSAASGEVVPLPLAADDV